jgi:hypothetical protein
VFALVRNRTIVNYSNLKSRRGEAQHKGRWASNVKAKQCGNVFVQNYVLAIFLLYSKTVFVSVADPHPGDPAPF